MDEIKDDQSSDCIIQETDITTISLDNSTIILDSTIESLGEDPENLTLGSKNDSVIFVNDDKREMADEEKQPFFHIKFDNHELFGEFSTLISSKIRDTLHEIDKPVIVELDRNENRIDFFLQNRNDVFMIDTLPTDKKNNKEVPSYDKITETLLHLEAKVDLISGNADKPKRNSCWNCGGDHNLRDCKEPRNMANISKAKQLFTKTKAERYHLDVEQKFAQHSPGTISENLRDALGLRKRELPLYIYKMRLYGYPPGWLEEAKVAHSGLTLFTSVVRNLKFNPSILTK